MPWALYRGLSLGTVAEIVAPQAQWAPVWPVGVGAALAWWLAREGGHPPRIPPGDVAVVIDRGVVVSGHAGAALLRADSVLRQWTVAGVSLLVLAALFGLALVAGR